MFIRKKTVKGKDYYQVVRTYRPWWKEGEDRKKVRQRVIASLGTNPSIEEAIRRAEGRFLELQRRKGSGSPEAEEKRARAEFKAFRLLGTLDDADYTINSGRGTYKQSPVFIAELRRQRRERRARNRADREAEKGPDPGFDEFWAGVEMAEVRKKQREHLAVLGLEPPANWRQVEEAYRRKAIECHPDHGGSAKEMARITAARDALLTGFGARDDRWCGPEADRPRGEEQAPRKERAPKSRHKPGKAVAPRTR
jgi:hypothetical protein